jgi:hypothetical protein
MVGPQSLGQALRGGRGLESKGQLLARRARREVVWLADGVMQLQHVWGEVMEVKDPSDAAVINGEPVTGLDDPREFAGAEGVRECQADNLLLERDRHLGFDRRLPAAMRQGPLIQ